jgi:hypothetical protein
MIYPLSLPVPTVADLNLFLGLQPCDKDVNIPDTALCSLVIFLYRTLVRKRRMLIRRC